jgi:hypothetical protein
MTNISESVEDAKKFLRQMRTSPFYTLLAVMVLAFAVSVGAFLEAFFKQLGESGGKATADVLASGGIAKLLPSRVTPLSYRVDVVNESADLDDGEIKNAVDALQEQVHNDLSPVWGVSAEIKFVARGKKRDPDAWWVLILDESDAPGMVSYHSRAPSGLPEARIFVRTAKRYGISWTVSASHELLSMLVDPWINLTVLHPGNPETFWAYEIAAPCEGDQYAYTVHGVTVSDFVTPAWFDAEAKPPESRFDFSKRMDKPFQVLSGGHATIYRPGHGWDTYLGSERPAN